MFCGFPRGGVVPLLLLGGTRLIRGWAYALHKRVFLENPAFFSSVSGVGVPVGLFSVEGQQVGGGESPVLREPVGVA